MLQAGLIDAQLPPPLTRAELVSSGNPMRTPTPGLRQAKRRPGRLHTGSQDDLMGSFSGMNKWNPSEFQMMPIHPTSAILLRK